ncbi:MAG: cytochrome c oxidase assembly protein [Candidatus Dadabacteria bacterium]|nr:MAG: cytochrome c oxidase assembly protein [Candidatus Dadabacteria bacterium]
MQGMVSIRHREGACALLFLLMGLLAVPAAAHVGGTTPVPNGLYWAIRLDIELIVLLAIATAGWLWLVEGRPGWRAASAWASATLLFYVTVASSIDEIGERYLFSVHMLQHTLLIYPIALLYVLALPERAVMRLAAMPLIGTVGRVLTRPLVAGFVFAAVFSGWHVPALYEWALRDRVIHNLEHLTFLISAMAMWWPVAGPEEGWPRASYGVQVIYLAGVTIALLPIFAFLTFARTVFYPTYAAAPRIVALSPIQDQVLGGAIMKIAAMVAGFATLAWVFLRWYEWDQSRQRRLKLVIDNRTEAPDA